MTRREARGSHTELGDSPCPLSGHVEPRNNPHGRCQARRRNTTYVSHPKPCRAPHTTPALPRYSRASRPHTALKQDFYWFLVVQNGRYWGMICLKRSTSSWHSTQEPGQPPQH